MSILLRHFATIHFVLLFSILTGCGGGPSASNSAPNSAPIPTATPIPSTTPTPEPSTFSLSGSITVASNIFSDSDVNDPSSGFVTNNTVENAQVVDNLSSIHGFLTHVPTGNPGDVFEDSVDQIDLFRVWLQENQIIRMRVVDFADATQSGAFSGDLDLVLFDVDLNVVASSMSSTELEEIRVTQDGEYFIAPMSVSGTSKYVLDIVSNFSSQTSYMHNIPTDFVIPNEAIIKQKNTVTAQQNNIFQSLSLKQSNPGQASLVELRSIGTLQKTTVPGMEFMQVLNQRNPESYQKLKTLEDIKALQQDDTLEYVSPNFLRKTAFTPNDQFFNFQWHYPSMNLPQAWDITTGTPATGDVIVAVIDTGVVLSHPELDSKLVPGFDFISDVNNSRDGDGIDNNPDDPGDSSILGLSSWHGTHVSGTIAAESNNNVGGAGVSFGAKIMPLRALGELGGSSFDIAQALFFAAGLSNSSGELPDQPASIINLSFGGPGSSAFEAQIYQDLFDLGIIVVAAAGNENSSELFFPASYPGVFSVAALDAVNNRAPYSSFGSEIDIAAPGGDLRVDLTGDNQGDGVLSTYIDDSSGTRVPTINFLNGTSMASPHVAGMFALMKALDPELIASDIDILLKAGSLTRDAGEVGRDDIFGYGIADALLAVQAAERLANGNDIPELPASILASPSQVNLSTGSTATVELRNSGGGAPSVIDIINPEAPWLTVSEESVGPDGLGLYRFDVDRTNLVTGTYLVTVRFVFDDANELQVNVSIVVGNALNSGNVSQLFVNLVDAATDEHVFSVPATPESDDTYVYTFQDIADGEYFVYAGSDVDNDGNICQVGEICGGFPVADRIAPILIDGDTFDVDILVNILSSFSFLNDSVVENSEE